jgi:hypothetical protein
MKGHPRRYYGPLHADVIRSGRCVGVDEPLWDDQIAHETELDRVNRHAKALAYCNQCPVRQQCQTLAGQLQLAGAKPEGIWGGELLTATRQHRLTLDAVLT